MQPEQIAQVRRFHRLVTQRAGALDDHFLGRGRPLGESRVLFEIGARGADLRDLRSRLGLDSGYLSRIVQSLVAAGLIELRTGPRDERVRRGALGWAGGCCSHWSPKRASLVGRRFGARRSARWRKRSVSIGARGT